MDNILVERREEKDASISLIRMVAMSFIIICHIFQTYGNELAWWFNVGVQIFLIISGYLYSKKDYSKESPLNILKKQFKKILLPYYLFLPIVIVLYSFLCPQYLSFTSIVKYILCCGVIEGQGHFWFIPYILFCYLITPYLYWIKSLANDYSLTKTLFTYCFVIIAFIILSYAFHSYFGASYIVCYFIGYFIGDVFIRFKEKFNIIYIITLCFALLFCGLKIYLLYVNSISLNGVVLSIFNRFKSYSHLLLGLAIFLTLLKLPNIKYNKVLSFSDKYSFEIFIVHCLFIRGSFHLLYITDYNILNTIIAIFCTIIASVLYKKICKCIYKTLKINA